MKTAISLVSLISFHAKGSLLHKFYYNPIFEKLHRFDFNVWKNFVLWKSTNIVSGFNKILFETTENCTLK